MLYLAKMVPPENGALTPQPDGGHEGWLKVLYKGEERWARPCYAMGRFVPPTEHWVRKFSERFAVWVAGELSPFGEESEDHLVYLGFTPVIDAVQDDVVAAFPEKKVLFSEKWELVVDDTATAPSVVLRYVGDAMNIPTSPADPGAVIFRVSQEPGAEEMRLEHVVAGAPLTPIGTNVAVNVQGDVATNINRDATLVVQRNTSTQVKGTSTATVDKKATITLNDELLATIVKDVTLALQAKLTASITADVEATLLAKLTASITGKVSATLLDELEANITKKVTMSVAAEVAASVSSKFDIQVDGQPGLKVEGGKATVGVGGESGVIFSALNSAWSTVMGLVAAHTHTLGSTVGNLGYPVGGLTDVSASLSTIASTPPMALAECQKLKIPPTGG